MLTHNNATAVGIVMALQFGPHVLLLPLTGFAADHLDRRKLLLATQAAMGLRFVFAGCWSRRITQEHRLVYQVSDERIDFLQARYHY
jgi:hypothetical protein